MIYYLLYETLSKYKDNCQIDPDGWFWPNHNHGDQRKIAISKDRIIYFSLTSDLTKASLPSKATLAF